MNVLNNKVLNLNKNWQILDIRNVKEVLVAMNGGDIDNPPVKALDINYPLKDNGDFDFDSTPSIMPVNWLEWITLPIRSYDSVINTPTLKIRCPTVVICVNYNKIKMRKFRPNKQTLFDLQKGVCGYSNKKIAFKDGNIEHIIPQSKGGDSTFKNLLFVDKKINFERGNKDLNEVGLKPLFSHRQPAPIPVSFTIKEIENNDWKWFLMK